MGRLLDDATATAELMRAAEDHHRPALDEFRAKIRAARDEGIPFAVIARAAGLSRERVPQLYAGRKSKTVWSRNACGRAAARARAYQLRLGQQFTNKLPVLCRDAVDADPKDDVAHAPLEGDVSAVYVRRFRFGTGPPVPGMPRDELGFLTRPEVLGVDEGRGMRPSQKRKGS